MLVNIQIKILSLLLIGVLFLACTPNSQRLRIRTDKSAKEHAKALAENNESDPFLQAQTAATDSAIQQQLQEKTINRVLNLFLQIETYMVKEEWDSAETVALEALQLVQNRDLLVILQTIYQSKNELIKADSCSQLIQRYDLEQNTPSN